MLGSSLRETNQVVKTDRVVNRRVSAPVLLLALFWRIKFGGEGVEDHSTKDELTTSARTYAHTYIHNSTSLTSCLRLSQYLLCYILCVAVSCARDCPVSFTGAMF